MFATVLPQIERQLTCKCDTEDLTVFSGFLTFIKADTNWVGYQLSPFETLYCQKSKSSWGMVRKLRDFMFIYLLFARVNTEASRNLLLQS